MSLASQFYQVAGTLAADIPSYVIRAADEELHQQVRAGKFCYVLTTRQMGKSSLMIRTAERLRAEGTLVANVDLTGIGGDEQSITADQWYYGIAYAILTSLGLDEDLDAWWDRRARLPALQRLMFFLRELVLAKTTTPVVIFVDEIDTTLNLSFADDFFAAIRACFNARAEDPEFQRLTFVLLGVASPADLIADPLRTPFNIGTRIDLADFQPEQAMTLAQGLGSESAGRQEALDRVLFWTGGHPYLTQKICLLAAESSGDRISAADIDHIVEREFLAPGKDREDDNLKFVRNRVAGRGTITRRLLRLYRSVLRGDRVDDVPTSEIHNELKLTGLVKARPDGTLTVRNAIYERVFNKAWTNEVRPTDNWRRATLALAGIPLLFFGYWFVVLYPQPYIDTLNTATGEESKTARVAFEQFGKIPFRGGQAKKLWGEYNIRRAQWAIDLDQQPTRQQDAYRAAQSAHAEASRFPDFRNQSDELLTRFFERRALRAALPEQRDETILWRLKALAVLPARPELRRAVSQFVDPGYVRLVRTIRTGLDLGTDRDLTHRFKLLSHDGRFLAALPSDDGILRVWDLENSDHDPLILRGRVARVFILAISPDGKHLVVVERPGRALHWRLDQPAADPDLLKVDGEVRQLVFSPDGNQLVAASYTEAQLWRLDHPNERPVAFPGQVGRLLCLTFSPDGTRIAIVGGTTLAQGPTRISTPRLWRVDQPTSVPVELEPQKHPISDVAFSPDGSHLVTVDAAAPCAIRCWRVDQPSAGPVVNTLPEDAGSPPYNWPGPRVLRCRRPGPHHHDQRGQAADDH